MKVYVLLTVLLFPFLSSEAQNLIKNGSFEIQSICPFGLIYKAFPWSEGSALPAKLYDTCDNSFNTYFGVPNNLDGLLGYQTPKDGHAYAGINVFSDTFHNVREYLKYEFSTSLEHNKNYSLTFYVNLVNYSRYSVDAIGAYFADSSLFCPTIPCILNYTPQVINPSGNIIDDTLGWTKVSGSFTAKGNEKYMIIGNFTPDSLVQKDTNLYISTWDWSTIYYIDDVSLYAEEDTLLAGDSSSLALPNVFSPNNDGVNDLFISEGKNIITYSCKIYNRYGEQVTEINDLNTGWDGHSKSGLALPAGVYFYFAAARGKDEKEYNLKGFVSLVR